MPQQMLPTSYHPVFDQYVEAYRKLQKETLSLLRVHGTAQQVQRVKIACLFHEYSFSRSEKTILVESAVAMLEDILAHPEHYDIPGRCSHFQPDLSSLWIEIQTPPLAHLLGVEIRGASFENLAFQEDLEAMRRMTHPRKHALVEEVFSSFSGKRYLDLVAEDGTVVFAFSYNLHRHQWYIPPEHVCPYGLCEGLYDMKQPCQRCQKALQLFSLWLPIAWVSLQGVFQQEEPEILLQQTSRRQQKQSNPKKKQTVKELLKFHVVRTIDISVKYSHLEKERMENEPDVRGSWLEKTRAVDPSRINPNVRTVPQRIRTLRHPRYANYIEKHGTNTIVVKEHQKSFPKLKQRVTRAKAKRYEKDDDVSC